MRRLATNIVLGCSMALFAVVAVARADHHGDMDYLTIPPSNCVVYNPDPKPGETVKWSTACEGSREHRQNLDLYERLNEAAANDRRKGDCVAGGENKNCETRDNK